MTVYLKGLSVPVILNITSGETDTTTLSQEIDSRLDLRIPRQGPASLVVSIPSEKLPCMTPLCRPFWTVCHRMIPPSAA
nr:DotH/IcmK family type IV secretion protein [Shigella sonnei]